MYSTKMSEELPIFAAAAALFGAGLVVRYCEIALFL